VSEKGRSPHSSPVEISISEFFEKNRHILGFDSPQKALYMIVKEALDNSLDACEENGILPDIYIRIAKVDQDRYEITIRDNGPGIGRKEIPNVFGKLLYGSRFHAYKQSRGQQGIGITAAVLYGQTTTGKPSEIITKRAGDDVAFRFVLGINVKNNTPNVMVEEPVIWDQKSGTEIKITARARYHTGKQSVVEYMRETAAVNPNMELTYDDPDGNRMVFRRVADMISRTAEEVKPYPVGLEIGEIKHLAGQSSRKTVREFLVGDFSRITPGIADEILSFAGVDIEKRPGKLTTEEISRIKDAMRKVNVPPPPLRCLSPFGEIFIRKGLMNVYGDLKPSFYSKPVERKPSVYNSNPFSVEVGFVYGGDLPVDQQIRIVRYANKVPLLYQAGACAITRAVQETDWRPYGLEQRGGNGTPYGPLILLVHVYGVRIPYTSESKEAVAPVPKILEEIKAALRTAGRELKRYHQKSLKRKKAYEKFNLVGVMLPEIARKSASLLGRSVPDIDPVISKIANVLFITEDISKNGDRVSVTCHVFNYTKQIRSFRLVAFPPVGNIEGTDEFNIEKLESSRRIDIDFQVSDVKGNYPGTIYYFKGIDPVHVLGAEPLPADWKVSGIEVEVGDS